MHRADPQFVEHLSRVLDELRLRLSEEQIRRIHEHYATLRHWNRRINLTSIDDPKEIAERHFGESLFLARELGAAPESVLDVGSGAGFPGLPLSIFHHDCRVTLLEPVGKKATFLKEVSRFLPNVFVLQHRLKQVEGTFEWATVRGVSTMPIIGELRDRVRKIAVLTTQSDARELRSAAGGWREPISLPWGRQRVLLLGNVDPPAHVPRET